MDARVAALEALFRHIAATRMAGVPVLNLALDVAARGFAPDGEGGLWGVLVTPWFMNLVRLPGPQRPPLAVGATRRCVLGDEAFDFIGAHEDGFGPFEACSLFSPMHEFSDQAAALATADAVVALLRPRPAAPAPDPARRRFLAGGVGARA